MRNILMLVGGVMLLGVGLGFVRGWFGVSTHDGNGRSNATMSFDKDKLDSDRDAVAETVRDMGR